ncbi:MAG: Lpp/OprI family alanine-zipper lipoprotein [Gammaproteobacteria bacterium]|nr:Lpp/OprI family alanine-zipper lipoprotein [Gammaproteobacteria bacterium]
MRLNLIKVSILALLLGLVGGCAVTPEQLQEVRAIADSALAEAQAATVTANNAHTVASEAAFAASQADANATAALECCNANTDRIDRMFKKAMIK